MKQLEVNIMGQSYMLGCPEGGEARLLNVVARVDDAMCKIREAGKVRSRDRIAVLAALNLAFDTPEQAAASTPDSLSTGLLQTDDAAKLKHLLHRLDTALNSDDSLI
ncbi:cell division protein ZapA [Rhodoferax sp.]|uniref:cell division protein ZapA n=1 Tax=Rhodoferax sp. TaxID=50421 RepID=UPI002626A674|nr:cell division protein ZapA [Rhodoferax sp.]MDD3935129.1 cell division protein ZapA [Rhodoferax sp.]